MISFRKTAANNDETNVFGALAALCIPYYIFLLHLVMDFI